MSTWVLIVMMWSSVDSGFETKYIKLKDKDECQRIGSVMEKHYKQRNWLGIDTFCVEMLRPKP